MHVTPAVRLLRPIGQGGMGKVWVAEHTGLKAEVVVKLLSRDVDDKEDAAARFSREASVAAAVKSPHVVQVFDYGVTADTAQPYIVMELLEGRDLSDYLAKNGRMAPNRDFQAVVTANFPKETKLVVGCKAGPRSAQAAALLGAAGYTDVVDMRGGFHGERDAMGRVTCAGWAEQNLPVETAAPPERTYAELSKKARG